MAIRHPARRGHTHTGSSGEISLALDDLTDVSATSPNNSDLIQWNGSAWTTTAVADVTGSLDHGNLSGLSDDDHPQYAGIAQTESISGSWTFTANPTIEKSNPLLYFDDSSAGTDQGRWALGSAGDYLTLVSTSDDGTETDYVLRAERDAEVVDQVWMGGSAWGWEWDIPVGWSTDSTSDSFAQFLRFGNESGAYSGTQEVGPLGVHVDSTPVFTSSNNGVYESTGTIIAKEDLTNGDDYLVIATANITNQNASFSWAYRCTVAGATTKPGKLGHFEAAQDATNHWPVGMAFFFNADTSTDDIEIEAYSNAATVDIESATLMAINLSDLGADNYETAYSATDTAITGSSGDWTTLPAVITLTNANGSDNWLIISSAEYDFFTGGMNIVERTTVDGVAGLPQTDLDIQTTVGNKITLSFQVITAPSAGDVVRIEAQKDGGVSYSVINQHIIAINLSSLYGAQYTFDNYYDVPLAYDGLDTDAEYFATPTLTADRSCNAYTIASFLGGYNGMSYFGPVRLKASVNSGSYSLISEDNTDTMGMEWGDASQGVPTSMLSDTATALTAGDEYVASWRQDVVGAGWANARHYGYFMLSFVDKATSSGGSGGQFTAGNSTYATDILGSSVTVDSTLTVTGASDFDAAVDVNGVALNIKDATEADYATFSHDGTDFNITSTGTTDINVSGQTTFKITTSAGAEVLRLTDSGASGDSANPYMSFVDDNGSRMAFVGMGSISNDDLYLNVDTGNIRLTGGPALFYGSGGGSTDYGQFNHDGTDFNTTFANTTDWNIYDVSRVNLFDGIGLAVYNGGNTDYALFTHNGTDFNTTLTNTVDWNVTGHTGVFRVQAANARLSIEETDATADEGVWELRANADTFYFRALNDAYGVEGQVFACTRTGSTVDDITFKTSTYVGAGNDFRIYNSGGTDYANFSHDGTDFNLAATNTTDYNLTGFSAIRFDNFVINPTAATVTVRDGDSFRVADSANTSYINIAHDSTDINTTFASTTEWNIDGADATAVVFDDADVYFANSALKYTGVITADASLASGDGWCNILTSAAGNSRGGGELWVSHSGGSGAPDVLHAVVMSSWDAETPSVQILKNSAGTGVSDMRLWYNSGDSSGGVDIQVSQASAQTYKFVWRPFNISTEWVLNPTTSASTTTATRDITVDDGHMWSLYGGSADTEALWFSPDTGFRIGNGGMTDYGQFSHDGTDFNMEFTNTTQVNVDTSTVFTGGVGGAVNDVECRSAVPSIWMYDTGQATDESAWKIYVNAGDLQFRATTDAGSSTGQTMEFIRGSGAAVDYIGFKVDTRHDQPLMVKERSGAIADVAAHGQIWTRDGTPTELMYTDDTGEDLRVAMITRATSGNLNDITAAINTDDHKVAGYMVWNTTTGAPVWSAGSTDGALWVDATGATAHTPA